MSTQSIIHRDKQDLNDKAEDVIICMSERLILNKKFMLGKEPNLKDFLDIEILTRILCENNCRLSCDMDKVKQTLNALIIKYNK